MRERERERKKLGGDKMGCTSLLRSPKKEEQEVPDAFTSLLPNSNQSYTYEDFNILEELEGVFNSKEEQELLQQNSSSGELHWDFMEWEELAPFGEEGEDENEGKEQVTESMSQYPFEEQQIKRENIVGFWEMDDEKMLSLNLNLNYQEVLDAWSNRGSLWADECSLSLATNNSCYVSIYHPLILSHASSSILLLYLYAYSNACLQLITCISSILLVFDIYAVIGIPLGTQFYLILVLTGSFSFRYVCTYFWITPTLIFGYFCYFVFGNIYIERERVAMNDI